MRKGIWWAVATLIVVLPVAAVAVAGPRVLAAEGTRVAIIDVGPSSDWHYEPSDIRVTPGSTVLWRNEGQQPHTVTARDKSFGSPYLVSGQEWQWTFSAPGEFTYYCEPHPWMKAVVRVGETPNPPAPAPGTAPPTATTTPPPSSAAPPAPKAAPPPKAAPAPPPAPAPAPATTTITTIAPVAAAAPAATTTTVASATTTTLAPTAGKSTTREAVGEAAASGSDSGSEDRNALAIALAVAATLAVVALGLKLLMSKP